MPTPENLAILRDVFVIAMLALAVAAGLYAWLRKQTDTLWNLEGNVLTRPYGPLDAVVALLLIGLFGVAFFVTPDAANGEAVGAADPLSLSSLVLQAITMLLLCLVVLGYLRLVRGLNPAEMFGLRQMTLKRSLIFAVPALIISVIAISLGTAALMAWNGGELPDTSTQETVEAFEKNGSLAFRVMLGFLAIVIAPLTEELLFRGFLYGVVKRSTDRWFAAFFTAVIFAVVHVHVGTAPQLFLLGLGLAIAYEMSGCLLVPVLMHAMFNAWNVAMLVWAVATN